MVLYKYFKNAPGTLPIQMVLSRVVCCQKPSFHITKCRDWFAKMQGRTVRPLIRLKVNTLVLRNETPFFLHQESILIQALGFHVLDKVDTLNYGGVSAMPPVPAPTPLHTVSMKSNQIFSLIREIYSPWNISALLDLGARMYTVNVQIFVVTIFCVLNFKVINFRG